MTNVDIRVLRVRSQLVTMFPFFGSLAMRLVPMERNDVQTMATDGKYLFYCLRFLDSIGEKVLLFVVCHEVLHCALGHHVRRGNREHELWNIACDYVVNGMLAKAGFQLWERCLYDTRFDGLNAEQVYRILDDERQSRDDGDDQDQDQTGNGQDDQDQDSGQDGSDDQDQDSDDTGNGDGDDQGDGDQAGNGTGDGSGDTDDQDGQPTGTGGSGRSGGAGQDADWAPAHGDPGGCGEVLDAAPGHDQSAQADAADDWQVFTRQAVNIARRQGEGKLPGFIEELVTTINAPVQDWRELLRRFVEPSQTKDYSWSVPNRRYVPLGLYTPGSVSDGVHHVALIIDSSYSISTEWLQRCGAEVQDALDNGAIDRVTIVFCDVRVTKTTEYVQGETIDLAVPGRGGTAFSPAFKWLDDNTTDLAAAIYFTDLDCSDFGPEPSYPVLWAVYGPCVGRGREPKVPFGEIVPLVD